MTDLSHRHLLLKCIWSQTTPSLTSQKRGIGHWITLRWIYKNLSQMKSGCYLDWKIGYFNLWIKKTFERCFFSYIFLMHHIYPKQKLVQLYYFGWHLSKLWAIWRLIIIMSFKAAFHFKYKLQKSNIHSEPVPIQHTKHNTQNCININAHCTIYLLAVTILPLANK